MRALVVLLLAALPAWGLLTPPASLPAWSGQTESCCSTSSWGSRFLGRRPPANPMMRCSGSKDGDRGTGTWGVDLSLPSWVAGATSLSRSALHASAPAGIGAWWNGGGFSGGGGGGGNNNGTDGGAPTGDAMDGGGDGEGTSDGHVCSSISSGSSAGSGDGPAWPPEQSFLKMKKGALFAPWVWLSAMWGLYAVYLRRSPLLTKALTSGMLALSGDLAAQFFEFRQQKGGGRKGSFLKDTRRQLAVAIDSMVITAPALHVLYGLLERLIPTAAGGFFPAASHLVIDTLVFDPAFVASFFCITGMLESRPLKHDVLPALRREFWPAVRGSWAVSALFCPIQFLTFRYLPLEFRVLSVNVCDIAWTSVMSYFSHKAAPKDVEAKGALAADAGGKRVLAPAEGRGGASSSGVRSGVGRRNSCGSGGKSQGGKPALMMAI